MITAKDAYTKVKELIQKDADALDAKCQHFVDTTVNDAIIKAIEDRQMYCGVEIPKGLKPATTIIQKKIEEAGFAVAVSHGYVDCVSIGWNVCE